MSGEIFEKSVTVPVDVGSLWDWHTRPGAFERLAPPWAKLVPLKLPDGLHAGAEAVFRIGAGPVSRLWRARIDPVEAPHRFVDTQVAGPFAHWRHEHVMTAAGPGKSTLADRVEYELPRGPGAFPLARTLARRELERLFRFRHARMLSDLQRHGGGRPGSGRTVLVSGSTGLIGGRLVPYLKTLGYRVRGLTRGEARADLFNWDPARGMLDPEALEGVEAVIHLAGENIASGRWTRARKARILRSRIDGTATIVRAMAKMERKPSVLVCASGVNFYPGGARGSDENGPSGDGFLAGVCRAWEAQALRARESGVRTVCLRTGVVLDPGGGALGRMLPVFRMGLGGRIGSGRQAFPWIGMDDLLDIYEWSIREESIEGAVNAVHPERVTQGTFIRCLGGILRRPVALPVPAGLVRLLFGSMGKETLLADLDVVPAALREHGYSFRHDSLEQELRFCLGRAPSPF
ncbi:MAG: TIGR01777 family oxidoreductase [Oceanipulchritudo sp.]